MSNLTFLTAFEKCLLEPTNMEFKKITCLLKRLDTAGRKYTNNTPNKKYSIRESRTANFCNALFMGFPKAHLHLSFRIKNCARNEKKSYWCKIFAK